MTFSALRSAGLVGGALLGIGAIGAMGGFGIAASTIVCIGLVVAGLGRAGERFSVRPWLALLVPIWVYQIALNGLLQVDLQVLNSTDRRARA